MNSRKTIGFETQGMMFKEGDRTPSVENLYVRATYDKKHNFGTLSIANDNKGILLQVTFNDIEKALRMAKDVQSR